jgi:hypothetical protein
MDINEYLKKKERRIRKRMVRLRDVSVFDFTYVPDSRRDVWLTRTTWFKLIPLS